MLLAELEEKRSIQKIQIDAKIQKAIDRRVEVVADGVKEKKALDDMVADKKLQIDENVRIDKLKSGERMQRATRAVGSNGKGSKGEEGQDPSKAGLLLNTSATSTTPAPAVGAVSLDVAPGYSPTLQPCGPNSRPCHACQHVASNPDTRDDDPDLHRTS